MNPSLIELVAREKIPGGTPGSSIDALGLFIGDDGRTYLVKTAKEDNPYQPASEWIGTLFASLIGIPSPVINVMRLPDGSRGAAIRWEGGTIPDYPDISADTIRTRIVPDFTGPDVCTVVSRSAVLDLFLHNNDRHINQYLRQEIQKRIQLLAIDYGRSLYFNEMPLPSPREMINGPSWKTYSFVAKQNGGLDMEGAKKVAEAIENAPDNKFEELHSGMPDEWIPATLRTELNDWFRTERKERIKQVMEVLHEI